VPLRPLFGAALVLLGVGATAVPSAYDEQPEARRVDGNRPVNVGARDLADIRSNNSPTLVRNPRNARELAVANRIDSPRYSCALHLSRDGGVSWSPVPIPAPAGEEPKCFAPDVAYGADGTLYLSFVTLRGRGNVPNAVWLSRLTRGRGLSKPEKLLGRLSFQVRLVADPVKPGRLYLTWLKASEVALYRFTNSGNPVSFMRSNDGGRTWQRPATVSDPVLQRAIAPSLAVGVDGELHVLYLDLGNDRLDYSGAHGGRAGPPYPGPWRLVHARSHDGGQGWQNSLVDGKIKPTERFIVFIPPSPSIAADRGSGRLYASFHDGRLGDSDVLGWTSSDGGRTWSMPRRVNGTQRRDGTQYLPKVAVAPNGRLDILYYDRRKDPRDTRNAITLQSSFDEAKSFSKPLRLSERAFDSRTGFGSERRLPDIGSRLGLVSTDSHALAVWTDASASTDASTKQDLTAALVAFSRPARLSKPVEYALRYGGLALALLGLGLITAFVAASLRSRRADS
jgi:hypothetical protein